MEPPLPRGSLPRDTWTQRLWGLSHAVLWSQECKLLGERSRDDAAPRTLRAVTQPWVSCSEQPRKHRSPECVLPAQARAQRPGQAARQRPGWHLAPLAQAGQEGTRSLWRSWPNPDMGQQPEQKHISRQGWALVDRASWEGPCPGLGGPRVHFSYRGSPAPSASPVAQVLPGHGSALPDLVCPAGPGWPASAAPQPG